MAWAQQADDGDRFPPARAAGRVMPGLVIDIDATIVISHSEKEQATATWKQHVRLPPDLLRSCDNTGEALAGILRPGRAGSNTAADHIAVLDRPSPRSPTRTATAPTS